MLEVPEGGSLGAFARYPGKVKDTQLQMLLRGQNLVGYRHYADDVVEVFVEKAAENGIDIFRIFDALNDIRNMESSIRAVKKHGKIVEAAVCYTISPVHSPEYFVELGERLVEMGADIICIKDMAGLLSPYAAEELIGRMTERLRVPVHLHTHETSGMGTATYLKAVESGVRILDTAVSPFASGTSQPPTETIVAALKGTEYDTGLDLKLLEEIAHYFRKVRKKYKEYESEFNTVNPSVLVWQIPGGMISNLANQLKEQNALDRMNEVLREVPNVRRDFGYPPLVTPTSQIVGTQATLNVLTGERYRVVTNETRNYLKGLYGRPPGTVDEELRRKILGDEDVVDVRPADLLEPELEKSTKELGDRARSIEDVLSYTLFPAVFLEFLDYKEHPHEEEIPEEEAEEEVPHIRYAPSEFHMTVHGDTYHVKVSGVSPRASGRRTYFLKIDGIVEEVIIEPLVEVLPTEIGEIVAVEDKRKLGRPRPKGPGDVVTLVPGTVVKVNVNVGDVVEKGDVLLIVEAMKMENEIRAPVRGMVKEVFVNPGDNVQPDETLVSIEVSE